MMTKRQLPLSINFIPVTVLASILLFSTTVQICQALIRKPVEDCTNKQSYFDSYETNISLGFKVLDAVKAQNELLRSEVSCSY